MQPNQQNPYDFIMSPAQKKRGIGLGGGSQKARIIQVVIVVAVVLIAGIGLFSLISGSKQSSADALISLAASQQDIIDITKTGSTVIRDQQLLIKNASVSLVMTSQYNDTVTIIKNLGNKSPGKQISAQQVKTYTKTLTDAEKNGNYDTVYLALLTNRIDEYRTKLQAAYVAAKTEKTKKQLNDFYQQIEVLYPPSKATD